MVGSNKSTSSNGCCALFSSYVFLLWDGLGFFGFDLLKLERLKGKAPRWYDRFKNQRWLVLNLIITIVLTYFLAA